VAPPSARTPPSAGLTIGQNAMVGAGAVVTRSVPPHAVVWVPGTHRALRRQSRRRPVERSLRLPGRALVRPACSSSACAVWHPPHSHYQDMRATPGREIERGLPFLPKRCFSVSRYRARKCVARTPTVPRATAHLPDWIGFCGGRRRRQPPGGRTRLTRVALYVPPMVWAIQYKYTADAVLLVMASDCTKR